MPKFSSPIVSENHMEDCIPLHTAHLEQHDCTALCNLDLMKEGMKHHPNGPMMGCTQHVRLGCELLEDGMNFVPNKFMQNHMFILELRHEIAKTP